MAIISQPHHRSGSFPCHFKEYQIQISSVLFPRPVMFKIVLYNLMQLQYCLSVVTQNKAKHCRLLKKQHGLQNHQSQHLGVNSSRIPHLHCGQQAFNMFYCKTSKVLHSFCISRHFRHTHTRLSFEKTPKIWFKTSRKQTKRKHMPGVWRKTTLSCDNHWDWLWFPTQKIQ